MDCLDQSDYLPTYEYLQDCFQAGLACSSHREREFLHVIFRLDSRYNICHYYLPKRLTSSPTQQPRHMRPLVPRHDTAETGS